MYESHKAVANNYDCMIHRIVHDVNTKPFRKEIRSSDTYFEFHGIH